MLRVGRGILIQLVVFVVIAAAGLVYTAAHFVGLSWFNPTYQVTAEFVSTGGVFTNAEVTYRGVAVGRVRGVRLTERGIDVDLGIEQKWKIPADTRAIVANQSAIGEQFVDLEPRVDSGPYLHDGSVIGINDTSVPPSDEAFIAQLSSLAHSVDIANLGVVVSELGNAFSGSGPALQRLIDAGNQLTETATANLQTDIRLIRDGQTVLQTQRDVAGQFRTFSANLVSLAQQLAASDPDLRRLLANGVTSAQQLQGLLTDLEPTFPTAVDNLNTLGTIQAQRLPGLKQILVLYPGIVATGFYGVDSAGRAVFGAATAQTPAVCSGPVYLPPSAHRPQPGSNASSGTSADFHNYAGPADLNADCASSDPGVTPRGGRFAPRPAGDTTGQIPHDYTLLPFPYGPQGGQVGAAAAPAAAPGGSGGASPSATPRSTTVLVPPTGATGSEQDARTLDTLLLGLLAH